MKTQADKHHIDKSFEEGDWVILNSNHIDNFQLKNLLIENLRDIIMAIFKFPKKLI